MVVADVVHGVVTDGGGHVVVVEVYVSGCTIGVGVAMPP